MHTSVHIPTNKRPTLPPSSVYEFTAFKQPKHIRTPPKTPTMQLHDAESTTHRPRLHKHTYTVKCAERGMTT